MKKNMIAPLVMTVLFLLVIIGGLIYGIVVMARGDASV